MPKRLRYTQVLGLNARGLTRKQKVDIVWKRDVKGKLNRSQPGKLTAQKRVVATNEYWDKYHDEEQRFDAFGLKEFLQNPCKISSIPQKERKIIYGKLRNAQLRIEYLKYKYSVAIPDKISLKVLSVLAKGLQIIQVKTSNHDNGYWIRLLTQRNVKCKMFNAHNPKHLKLLSNDINNNNNNKVWNNKKKKTKKNKHKNLQKSKKILAAEAKQWTSILNRDCSSKINDILKDYSNSILLMIYPDFVMDDGIINEVIKRENRRIIYDNKQENGDDDESFFGENDNGKYQIFGSLIDTKDREEPLPSVECLRHFKGNYVVHIGELFGCTYNTLCPWGRTTSMQFQIELQTNFHKIHQHEMRRWPLFRDTLTIWRRNKIINVGNEKIINIGDIDKNDSFNTKFWQSIYKQRVNGQKDKNMFQGSKIKNKPQQGNKNTHNKNSNNMNNRQ